MNFLKTTFDLNFSLKPSFILSLFIRYKDLWIKIAGFKKYSYMSQINGIIISDVDINILKFWTGVWYNPFIEFEKIKPSLGKSLRVKVQRILETYHKVSLCVSPYDKDILIVPIVLSRRTDYERNVLRWCARLWNYINSIEDILNIDISLIGRSYQIIQLKNTIKDFIDKVLPIINDASPEELRIELIKCKWIGPKVADAYLLFTGLATDVTPVDIHLIRMLRRIPLVKYEILPKREYCSKYLCRECPINDSCIRYIFSNTFKRLAGWLQTVFYLHDRLYCQQDRCNICKIRDLCKK